MICGNCLSDDVEEVQSFEGELVEADENLYEPPSENLYEPPSSNIVIQCRKCGDVTGYLLYMTGVVRKMLNGKGAFKE
jgi:hypothetical protein